MGRYELVYFDKNLYSGSSDYWRRKIENIDGEIVEPLMNDGYTRGFVVDTEAARTNA